MNKATETLWKKTRKLPDLSSMQTQHLVKIEQCPNCHFFLFPGEQTCSSCGSRVPEAAQPAGPTGQSRTSKRPQSRLLGALVICIATILFGLMLETSYRQFGRFNTLLCVGEWLAVGIVLIVMFFGDRARGSKATGNKVDG